MKYLLVLCLCLTGCSSLATYTLSDGQVIKARINGLAESKLETPDGYKLSIKRKPLVEIPDLNKIDLSRED